MSQYPLSWEIRLVSGYVSHLLIEGSITVTTAGASAITTQSLLQTLFREIRVTIAGADSRLKIRGDQLFQMNSLFSTSAPNVTISNAIGAGQVQLCSMVKVLKIPNQSQQSQRQVHLLNLLELL